MVRIPVLVARRRLEARCRWAVVSGRASLGQVDDDLAVGVAGGKIGQTGDGLVER
jgi:hypothetical protein